VSLASMSSMPQALSKVTWWSSPTISETPVFKPGMARALHSSFARTKCQTLTKICTIKKLTEAFLYEASKDWDDMVLIITPLRLSKVHLDVSQCRTRMDTESNETNA